MWSFSPLKYPSPRPFLFFKQSTALFSAAMQLCRHPMQQQGPIKWVLSLSKWALWLDRHRSRSRKMGEIEVFIAFPPPGWAQPKSVFHHSFMLHLWKQFLTFLFKLSNQEMWPWTNDERAMAPPAPWHIFLKKQIVNIFKPSANLNKIHNRKQPFFVDLAWNVPVTTNKDEYGKCCWTACPSLSTTFITKNFAEEHTA